MEKKLFKDIDIGSLFFLSETSKVSLLKLGPNLGLGTKTGRSHHFGENEEVYVDHKTSS